MAAAWGENHSHPVKWKQGIAERSAAALFPCLALELRFRSNLVRLSNSNACDPAGSNDCFRLGSYWPRSFLFFFSLVVRLIMISSRRSARCSGFPRFRNWNFWTVLTSRIGLISLQAAEKSAFEFTT